MKIITTLIYKNEEFKIVKKLQKVGIGCAEEFYCAVNVKELDEYNRLKRALNGFDMNASRDLDECIRTTKMSVDVAELREAGKTPQEIMEYMIATYVS